MPTLRHVLAPAALVLTLGLVGCTNGGGPTAPDVDPNAPAASTTPGVAPGPDDPGNVTTQGPVGLD